MAARWVTTSRGPPRCETSAEICIITDRFSNLPSWNAGVFRYTFQLREFNDQLNASTNQKRDERSKTIQVSFTSLGSTAKTKSLTIYEITRLYSNSSFTFMYLYTSLSSFTQGAHTSTHHIHDFRGN